MISFRIFTPLAASLSTSDSMSSTAKLGEGITPSEARTVIDLAEGIRKSLEMTELEKRLCALEEKAIGSF
jgi:hypothetical protein